MIVKTQLKSIRVQLTPRKLHVGVKYYVVHVLQVLVKVPTRVLYGNYWARGKFEKVM